MSSLMTESVDCLDHNAQLICCELVKLGTSFTFTRTPGQKFINRITVDKSREEVLFKVRDIVAERLARARLTPFVRNADILSQLHAELDHKAQS